MVLKALVDSIPCLVLRIAILMIGYTLCDDFLVEYERSVIVVKQQQDNQAIQQQYHELGY